MIKKGIDIKSLVVGVDLSDYSKVVVREARQIASKMKLPIVFVYVFQELSFYENFLPTTTLEIVKDLEKEVRSKYSVNVDESVVVKLGAPSNQILEVAKKNKNPLILVGHRGHNPVVSFFLGSTAEKLALMSSYPVWIHRGRKVKLPKKILVPFDFSLQTEKTMKAMAIFKKSFNASIETFHVFQDPLPLLNMKLWSIVYREMKAEDDKGLLKFQKKYPSLKVVRSTGEVTDKIQQRSKAFDLIALSPKPQKGSRAFGRVTAKLVRSGNKPVLIIP
jgi:nucleotide-binding universal stress UspA family protein